MSSEYSVLVSLTLFHRSLYRFGGPVMMGLGSVSCIISILVFTKKNLRKNPCSTYLLACNISNFLLIFTSILFATLANGYNIDPTAYSLSFCHFRFYTTFLFDVLSPSYLILASVDRIFLTSRNALTRQRSTLRFAYISITIITWFWLLLHVHTLILTKFVAFGPDFVLCYFQPGLYVTIVGFYSLVIKGIIIPLLMIVLGAWAVRNIRGATQVTSVSVGSAAGTGIIRNTNAGHSKDRQLLRILLIDISVYVIFNLMVAVVLMYQQIKQISGNDLVEIQIQTLLFSVGVFSTYIPFCVGCYTNLLVSKIFRKETKTILMCT